ncbi:MAG: hypothetical protein IKL89_08105 [Clostridia bacterium]|nr:hypothetical protein [Clostridia bacterium]
MKYLKLLFQTPFRALSPGWRAARIALILAGMVLLAYLLDRALLGFLESVVNRAGPIRHFYERQIAGS